MSTQLFGPEFAAAFMKATWDGVRLGFGLVWQIFAAAWPLWLILIVVTAVAYRLR